MMDEILPNLFLGTVDDAAKLGTEVPQDWVVLAVTEYYNEMPNEPKGFIWAPFMATGKADLQMLDKIAETIGQSLKAGKKVLVHCVFAHERSPLAIAWYLVYSGHSKDLNDAYDFVIQKHPQTQRRLYWLPMNARPYPYNGDVFRQ